MYKLRVGNDINIQWRIFRNGEPEDFTGKELRLLMRGTSQTIEVTGYTIVNNVLKWTYLGKDQKGPSTFTFTLIENEGREDMFTIDKCDVLRLVSCSCQADDDDGPFDVFVDTDIVLPAPGRTPVIEAGDTVTLEPGSKATAEVVRDGDDESGNPKYKVNFGIPKGQGGSPGATFTPAVDAEGNLSWTNDKGLDNPQAVNIKGPKGDTPDTSSLQPKTDEALQTTDKTVAGGINEVNAKAADAPTLALRKLYEAAGAVYNEETGFYELNGLTDITEEEMLDIYNVFHDYSIRDSIFLYAYKTNVRTNLVPRINTFTNEAIAPVLSNEFYYSSSLEVIRLCDDTELFERFGIHPKSCDNMFAGCLKLKKIMGILFGDKLTKTHYMFGRCQQLADFRIKELNINISFEYSPLINYESVSYLIENAANTSAITVTVHPTTYSYLTGTAQPSAEVGGTSEEWQALLTTAQGKQISFATTE